MFSLPKWDVLRAIGNSKIAKLSISMPFIGYLLIFNKYVLDALRDLFTQDSRLSSQLIENYPSFIFNMYILYLGFLAFGTASIIYQLFCDKVVKQFESENEFAAFRIGVSTVDDIASCCQYIRTTRGYDKSKEMFIELISATVEDGVNKEINTPARLSVYKRYYDLKNTANIPARLLAIILYMIGIALVSIPAVKTTYKVVATIFV